MGVGIARHGRLNVRSEHTVGMPRPGCTNSARKRRPSIHQYGITFTCRSGDLLPCTAAVTDGYIGPAPGPAQGGVPEPGAARDVAGAVHRRRLRGQRRRGLRRGAVAGVAHDSVPRHGDPAGDGELARRPCGWHGIDRPLIITKNGVSVLPHQNWRGMLALGTNPAGGLDVPDIDWPGYHTTPWHGPTRVVENWFGSLSTEMRDATGQLYKRNRYYDPASGQFTQPDPIGLAGGLNSYGFAAGDPVSYSDPYGLKVDCGDRRKSEACWQWEALKASAQDAMRSDHESVTAAGRHLMGMINDLEQSEQTYQLRIGHRSGIVNWRDGGGWTQARSRVDSEGRQIIRSDIDVSYGSRKSRVPLAAIVAHEAGHAWGLMKGMQDFATPAVDAENAYRTLRNCAHRASERGEIPRCVY